MSKQHKAFCTACGKTTNHLTLFQKAADGSVSLASRLLLLPYRLGARNIQLIHECSVGPA